MVHLLLQMAWEVACKPGVPMRKRAPGIPAHTTITPPARVRACIGLFTTVGVTFYDSCAGSLPPPYLLWRSFTSAITQKGARARARPSTTLLCHSGDFLRHLHSCKKYPVGTFYDIHTVVENTQKVLPTTVGVTFYNSRGTFCSIPVVASALNCRRKSAKNTFYDSTCRRKYFLRQVLS